MKENKKEETKEMEKEKVEKKFEQLEENPKKLEEEIKEMSKETQKETISKKKYIVISIIIGIIIILGLFISTIFALVNINNEKIAKGVFIEGIDMSGISKEEAKIKLESIYNEKKTTEIKIKHNEYESTISPELIETNYDIDKAVDEADNIGKSDNIFVNNYNILFTLIGKRNIDVDMSINEDVAKQTIDDINVNLPDGVIESSYSVDDDELTISKGKAGVVIDENAFLEIIKYELKNIDSNGDQTLEIPVVNKEPEAIDIEKIHDEICKEPQDAYFTKNPFAVYPEVKGISFDLEKAKEILQEDKDEYVIKLTITNPKVTLDKIGPEAFPDKLATFSTRYDVSDKDRTTNLELACNKINGTVVLSGDTFSYNKVVGARTAGAGYKNAKIYEAGKVVDGIGGGICQISSTLYNAVLNANLEIVERKNHQFVTSYVEPGMDATVVYGLTDFKFKNTRTYAIKIKAGVSNGIATISIYGIKEENEYTTSFETKTISSIPFTVKYVDDATLSTGTEKVKQKGANGLISETYMIKSLNGKVVSRELLSRDTYSAMQKIILKGTKGAANNPTTNNSNTNNNNNNNKNDTTTVNTKPASDNKTNESNEIKNETSKPTNTTNTQKESNVSVNKAN